MEFNNQNGTHVQNGAAATTSKAAQNGEAKKEANSGKAHASEPKHSPTKGNAPGSGKAEQPKPEDSSKVEPGNTAPKPEEVRPAAPALNLESKLKAVEDLHRRSIQRINLISRIRQLEAFEVALAQENDELEDNPYQGCRLIIEDDKKRQFVTTTPGLIRLVSQFIYNACNEKRVEIEASIVFPVG